MLREERRIPQTYNYLYSPTSNEVDLYLSFPFPHSPHCVVYVFQCTVLCMRQAGVYFLLWVSGVYAMAKKVKHKLNIGHPTLLCLKHDYYIIILYQYHPSRSLDRFQALSLTHVGYGPRSAHKLLKG